MRGEKLGLLKRKVMIPYTYRKSKRSLHMFRRVSEWNPAHRRSQSWRTMVVAARDDIPRIPEASVRDSKARMHGRMGWGF